MANERTQCLHDEYVILLRIITGEEIKRIDATKTYGFQFVPQHLGALAIALT